MKIRLTEIWRVIAGTFLIVFPVIVFYSVLTHEATSLPLLDDYDSLLGFMNGFAGTHGFVSRLLYYISAQHTQYKLLFAEAIVIVERILTGKINLLFLQQVGNSFVLLSAIALWLLFRPRAENLGNRLLLFLPIVLLLFAPQYVETLNWAMIGLQNVAVPFFALLCFYFLAKPERRTFIAACLCMMGAIACSGNGIFVAIAGFLFAVQHHGRFRSIAWLVLTGLLCAIYSYHLHRYTIYNYHPPHPTLTFLAFPFLVLGSAYAISPATAFFMGLCALGFGSFLLTKRWHIKDPSTFYAAVWVLMTATGIAITRHTVGVPGALASRYRIYSLLLTILLYMAVLALGLERRLQPENARLAWAIFAMFCLTLNGVSELAAFRTLRSRRQLVERHYSAWLRDPEKVSLVPDEDSWIHLPEGNAFRKQAALDFRRAVELGFYDPPKM